MERDSRGVVRSFIRLIGCALAIGSATIAVSGSAAAHEGFGASTPGGSGMPIARVTNLNDAGPGSLRDALSGGYRRIVFDVAGDIALTQPLWVTGPFVTIDGFTAPPPGITLRHRGLTPIRNSS